MSEWKALHAHHAAIDTMLLDVVGPFLESYADELEHGFWERHYAGGPHLRVRLCAQAGSLERLTAELRAALEQWLHTHPSPALKNYSPARAAALLRMEGTDPELEDLAPRSGVVIERSYPESARAYFSPRARQVAEDFQRARGPLALAILGCPRRRRDVALELFLALALFIGRGRYPNGSVSFKSHWEHFAATSAAPALIERVDESYRTHRSALLATLPDVHEQWRARDRLSENAILGRWWKLLDTTHRQVAALLESGYSLVRPSTREEIVTRRERLRSRQTGFTSTFIETMWADETYLAGIQHDGKFQRPRALVNLLYNLVASLGMNPLEKMAMCHHAFRAVEESFGCNLDEVLKANVRKIISGTAAERYAHS